MTYRSDDYRVSHEFDEPRYEYDDTQRNPRNDSRFDRTPDHFSLNDPHKHQENSRLVFTYNDETRHEDWTVPEPEFSEENFNTDRYNDRYNESPPGSSHHRGLPRSDNYLNSEERRGINCFKPSKIDPRVDFPTDYLRGDGIFIDKVDLRDIERDIKFPYATNLAFKWAVALGFVTVAGLMYASLKPDVSAYDIIRSEQYQSEFIPDQPLTSDNTTECSSLAECIKNGVSSTNNSINHRYLREIPANNNFQPAAAQDESIDPLPTNLHVLKQWSNLRDEPIMSGNIITSVTIGQQVKVLGKVENWFHVQLSNQTQTEGYMHANTLTSLK